MTQTDRTMRCRHCGGHNTSPDNPLEPFTTIKGREYIHERCEHEQRREYFKAQIVEHRRSIRACEYWIARTEEALRKWGTV